MRDRFREAGLANPALDARLLAQHMLGYDALGLLSHEADPIGIIDQGALSQAALRRLRGEPVARIIGRRGFYGLDFALSPATLVPRPETELLVDFALLALRGKGPARLLDLGTGSGCIAISVLANVREVTATATDLNPDALIMARLNATHHGVADRLTFIEGSWTEKLPADQRFACIVSNPPYIESAAIDGLPVDVRAYDPRLALDGGSDGLDPYRILAETLPAHLDPGGVVMVEIGSTQGEAVSALFEAAGFSGITLEKDLAGLDRVVIAHHFS
ncbi:MAG: Protein-N(5)-glutamine methyltransferase PrmC, methylates polypeptide chain release factor [Devosia sp.]|nr:Protein-N(5)-glutamine methyltransferase PrmC, methylates polypeptide chain release factor [Devosia sp.]